MTPYTISFEEVAADMQTEIDRWEGGLKTTGGAIVPEKSWIYKMNFEANEHGDMILQLEDIDSGHFTVLDCNDVRKPLPSVNINKGKETLGVYLAPDGNNQDAVKEMSNKAKQWSDNIRAGHINRNIAWQALETTIMKTLKYLLPALMLSEE